MDCTEIEAAIKTNLAAQTRAWKRVERLREEHYRLRDELHKEKLRAVIGGAVVTHFTGRYPDLDKLVGTLTEVRRTRCSVDFGGKLWDMLLEDILPAADAGERGYTLFMGGQQ